MAGIELIISSICNATVCEIPYDDSYKGPDTLSINEIKYKNLMREINGKTIKVGTYNNTPLSGTVRKNGTLVGLGVAFIIMNILSKKFNFTYEIVEPKRNYEFGGRAAEDSLIGLLNSSKIDMVAAFLPSLIAYRKKVSLSIDLDEGVWVMMLKRPKESATGSGLLAPFNDIVWYLVLAAVVTFGPCITFFTRIRNKIIADDEGVLPLNPSFWFVYSAFLKQGTSLSPEAIFIPLFGEQREGVLTVLKPIMKDWLERQYGSIFWLTQIPYPPSTVASVLTALSFYATGSYQKPVGMSYLHGLSQSSVSKAVKEVTSALNNNAILQKYICFPQSQQERNIIINGFSNKFGIPGCVGCIDCTHVALIQPTNHSERFFNRKHYHSRNVQIICDSDLNILNIDASFGGATHDAHIWRNSGIQEHLQELQNRGESIWLLDTTRVLFVTWWLFMILLSAFYTANLTAFLTLSKFTLAIEYPQDLYSKNYRWISAAGSSVEYSVKTFGEEMYYLNPMVNRGRATFLSVRNDEEFLDPVKDGAVLVKEQTVVDHLMYHDYISKKDVEESDRCTYVVAPYVFMKRQRSFAYPMGSPLKTLFDPTLTKIFQSGILTFLKQKGLPTTKICPLDLQSKDRKLRNSDLIMTYIVMGVGSGIAVAVFASELIFNRYISVKIHKGKGKKGKVSKSFMSTRQYDDTRPPPYESLFGNNSKINYENTQTKIINGREYYVIESSNGGKKLVPVRAPSSFLYRSFK